MSLRRCGGNSGWSSDNESGSGGPASDTHSIFDHSRLHQRPTSSATSCCLAAAPLVGTAETCKSPEALLASPLKVQACSAVSASWHQVFRSCCHVCVARPDLFWRFLEGVGTYVAYICTERESDSGLESLSLSLLLSPSLGLSVFCFSICPYDRNVGY